MEYSKLLRPVGPRAILCLCASPILIGCATADRTVAATEPPIAESRFEQTRVRETRRIVLKPVSERIAPDAPDMSRSVSKVGFEVGGGDIPPAPAIEEDLAPLPAPPTDSIGLADSSPFYPIDLATALRLAGANNLQIAFAREQVQAALAREDRADVLWVPSLRAGLVYNYHSGPIQDTSGTIVDVDRGSLFVGGGMGSGNSPLTGPAGGPRMFVDLPLVDVLFEPLAARQSVCVAQANQTAAFNDTLLETTLAYIGLLRETSSVVIAEEAVTNASELARLSGEYARTGQGLQADADRAQAELKARQRAVLESREQVAVRSAELARILRLDPATRLAPLETVPAPLHLVDRNADVRSLISQAQSARPEMVATNAAVQETWYRTRQEHWRPWTPHIYAGTSGGGFGGGQGADIDDFGGRADFDVAALWQVENLGLGNAARRRERESQNRQSHLAYRQMADRVAMEVTQAHQRIQYRASRIDVAEDQVRSASEALRLNLEGIQQGVLRPIEIQQAIGALALARQAYLDSVMDYNQAQFALLRAIGHRPENDSKLSQDTR